MTKEGRRGARKGKLKHQRRKGPHTAETHNTQHITQHINISTHVCCTLTCSNWHCNCTGTETDWNWNLLQLKLERMVVSACGYLNSWYSLPLPTAATSDTADQAAVIQPPALLKSMINKSLGNYTKSYNLQKCIKSIQNCKHLWTSTWICESLRKSMEIHMRKSLRIYENLRKLFKSMRICENLMKSQKSSVEMSRNLSNLQKICENL